MSAESLQKIADAIMEHLHEEDEDQFMLQWVVGYEVINSEDCYHNSYITGPGSPSSAVGLARMTESAMRYDLDNDGEP